MEAAVTLAAINSHLHGIPPSVNQVAPSHTGAALSNDLQAETAHLIRVAHAMKHWPSVPGLGQPSVLERTIRRRASHLPVRLIARIWRELAAIPAGCMYYAALVREHPAAQPVRQTSTSILAGGRGHFLIGGPAQAADRLPGRRPSAARPEKAPSRDSSCPP